MLKRISDEEMDNAVTNAERKRRGGKPTYTLLAHLNASSKDVAQAQLDADTQAVREWVGKIEGFLLGKFYFSRGEQFCLSNEWQALTKEIIGEEGGK